MILVFILIFIALAITVIILSSIKLEVANLVVDNEEKVEEKEEIKENELKSFFKIVKQLDIYIQLCFLGKIKMVQIEIDLDKLKRIPIKKIKEKMSKVDINELRNNEWEKRELKKAFKSLNMNLEKLDLKLNIGTIDVLLTTALVTIISTAIGIFLPHVIRKYKKGRYYYKIEPIYTNQNKVKFNFKGIICIKVVHIIYVIYILIKMRRVKENERTSNRRSYDYSYE